MSTATSYSAKGLMIWGVCVLFFFYEYLLRTVLGTFQNPITDALHLTPVRFALLSSTAYLFIYAAMQVPVGISVERYGLKKSLFVAVSISVIGTIGFAHATNYHAAIVFRLLMGFGSSFGFVSLLIAVYEWMPRRNIALFIGLSQLIGTMGPMMAGGPMSSLAETSLITWRSMFEYLGIFGVIIGCLVLMMNDKKNQTSQTLIVLSRETTVIDNLQQLLRQPQIWFIALFNACIYFSLEYLSENECKNFLVSKGFSPEFSSYMITLAWIGFAISSPIFGSISDKLMRRKQVMSFSAVTTCICLIAIVYLHLNSLFIALLFLCMGVGIGASSVGIVTLSEQCKSSYLALGLGLNNGITILFVSIVAPILGVVLNFLNAGMESTLENYQVTFSIMILFPFIAAGLAMFCIVETYAKPTKENVMLNPKALTDNEG